MIQKQRRVTFSSKLSYFSSGRQITKKMDEAANQLKDDIDYREGKTDLNTCLWAVAADSSLLKLVPEEYRTSEVCIKGIMIDFYTRALDYRDYNPNIKRLSWADYSDSEVYEYMTLIPKETMKNLITDPEMLDIMVHNLGMERLFDSVPADIRTQDLILRTLPYSYDHVSEEEKKQRIHDEMGLYIPEKVPKEKRTELYYANTVRLSIKNLRNVPQEFLTKEVYLAAIEKRRTNIKKVPKDMLDASFIKDAVKRNWKVVLELDRSQITEGIIEYVENINDYYSESERNKWVRSTRL